MEILRPLLRPLPGLALAQASTIPSSWYRSPQLASLEAQHIFGATWQQVARSDQLADPGQYITADIGGEPILVVRDREAQLRALSNVCRHRAAILLRDPAGCTDKLRCRYHGWTYDLAGRLRGTPEWEGVADFTKEQNGLPEHHVAEWGGLVWVHLRGEAPPLADFLAPMPAQLAGQPPLRFVERRSYDIACNWKVFVDNYLDGGYHVPTVHPSLNAVLDYSAYTTTTYANTSLQRSPIDPTPSAGSAATVRTGDEALYWWVFPNFMLNRYQGFMDTNLVLPTGPERCRVIIDFFADSRQHDIAESVAVGHQIQLEDIGVCEDVQRGLASRFYDTGRYSARREVAVYHFHRLLEQALRPAAQTPEAG